MCALAPAAPQNSGQIYFLLGNALNKFGADGRLVSAQAAAMDIADRLGGKERTIAAIRARTTWAAPRARTAAESVQAAEDERQRRTQGAVAGQSTAP